MLLCIPVSLSDAKNIPLLEKAFEVFPPGSGHRLLVIGSPNASGSVEKTAQNLSKHFAGNASTYIFDLDSDMGWPTACNYYFQQAAWFIGSSYDEPWLWYELDTTPTRAGWLDEIEDVVKALVLDSENQGRKPPRYFGTSEPACLEYQGALMPNAGRQMAAVGVYPSNMNDVLSLRAISATNIIWNTFLRWYVMPFFAELPLIQNNWQTARYRLGKDGAIESDSVARWAWDVHFNKPLRQEAALVHGCKDGSLLDILITAQIPDDSHQYWTDYKEPTREEKAEKAMDAHRKLIEKTEAVKAASKRK
jgi:hypothetical protein